MSQVLIAFLLTFGSPLDAEMITPKSVEPIHKIYKQTASEREKDLRKWVGGYGESFGGIDYKWGGKTTKGFDCSGFTKYIFNAYGVELSGHSGTQATQGNSVSLKEAKPGDLIFFGHKGRVTHVGIICENTEDGIIAVHSTCSKGIMKQNVSKSSYWSPKILFARDVITRYIDEEFSQGMVVPTHDAK